MQGFRVELHSREFCGARSGGCLGKLANDHEECAHTLSVCMLVHIQGDPLRSPESHFSQVSPIMKVQLLQSSNFGFQPRGSAHVKDVKFSLKKHEPLVSMMLAMRRSTLRSIP